MILPFTAGSQQFAQATHSTVHGCFTALTIAVSWYQLSGCTDLCKAVHSCVKVCTHAYIPTVTTPRAQTVQATITAYPVFMLLAVCNHLGLTLVCKYSISTVLSYTEYAILDMGLTDASSLATCGACAGAELPWLSVQVVNCSDIHLCRVQLRMM